jgi:hypothetical protein
MWLFLRGGFQHNKYVQEVKGIFLSVRFSAEPDVAFWKPDQMNTLKFFELPLLINILLQSK